MSSSLPDGFEVRFATDDDAAAVAELARASEHAVLGVSVLTEGDMRDWWRLTDPGDNVWLIHGEGRLAAGHSAFASLGAAAEWGWRSSTTRFASFTRAASEAWGSASTRRTRPARRVGTNARGCTSRANPSRSRRASRKPVSSAASTATPWRS